MLDFFERIELLGANDWSLPSLYYYHWADMNNRLHRDQDSLKNKIYKLAASKNPTGVGQCPENTRRANNISRGIHGKLSAVMLGDKDDKDDEDTESVGIYICYNSRELRRKCVPSLKHHTDYEWMEQINTMTTHI